MVAKSRWYYRPPVDCTPEARWSSSRAGDCIITITYDVTRLFFFFQAEDGIRDLTVTGVQTCALPIFAGNATGPDAAADVVSWDASSFTLTWSVNNTVGPAVIHFITIGGSAVLAKVRSEERRGGEGGRFRGGADHLKKKRKVYRAQRDR